MEQHGQTFTDGRKRPLKFIELDSGCYVCTSHKHNSDGYLRFNTGDRTLKMFHRGIWEAHKGLIPEEHEINHLCKNRACQNVDHMECIPGTDHAVKTNEERYADRKLEAEKHWRNTECTGTALGELFGVSFGAACGWIREWRNNV